MQGRTAVAATRTRMTRLKILLLMAITLSAAGENIATAQVVETPRVRAPARALAAVHANRFDWFAKTRHVQNVAFIPDMGRPVLQIGSGSYICSPAGFGHKSRCYSN